MHRRSKYCPHCQSDKLKREHRGFLKKKIFRVDAQYKCMECDEVFSINAVLYSRLAEKNSIPEKSKTPEQVAA